MLGNNHFIKISIVVWVLINVPLFYFFYDYYNLNSNLISSSLLYMGLNPYSQGSTILASVFIQPYLLLTFYLYAFTNFNIQYTVFFVKSIAAIFSLLSALLVFMLSGRLGTNRSKAAFVFFLFNPFILFVNDVWVQPEFIPIFFILLALYFFNSANTNHSLPDLIIISVSLIIASLTFYFPIFIIPAFLLYFKRRKDSIILLLLMLVEIVPFIILITFFGVITPEVTSLSSFISFSANSYSLFSFFSLSASQLKLLETSLLVIILTLSFLVPLILKRVNFPLELSIYAILAIVFVLYSENLLPDSYTLIVPFIVLLGAKYLQIYRYLRILLFQVFLFFSFSLAFIYDGLPYVTGIFYWIYPFLHYAVPTYQYIPDLPVVHTIAILIVVVSILASLLVFILRAYSYHAKFERKPVNDNFSHVQKSIQKPKFSRILVIVLLVIVLVFTNEASSNVNLHNDIKTSDIFPQMLFYYTYGNGDSYQIPSPNLIEYIPNSNTYYIWNQPNGLGISRNITSQYFDYRGSMSMFSTDFPNEAGARQILIDSTNITAGIDQLLVVNNETQILVPEYRANISTFTDETNSLGYVIKFSSPPNLYSYGNNSISSYDINLTTFSHNEITFGAKLDKWAGSQNILWTVTLGEVQYEAFITRTNFYAGYYMNNSWNLQSMKINIQLSTWFEVGINFSKSGYIVASLNGYDINIPYLKQANVSSVTITTGKYPGSTPKYSFSGAQTKIFLLNRNESNLAYYSYVKDKNTGNVVLNYLPSLTRIPFSILNSPNSTFQISLGNSSCYTAGSSYVISFGLLSTPFSSLAITTHLLIIGKFINEINYFLLVVEDTVIFPSIVFAIGLFRQKPKIKG